MAEMPRQLTQAEIDRILFNQRMGMQPTPPSIQNLRQGTSGTVTSIPDNFFQRAATGARAAGQFVNQAGTAADIAKLFPGYTGQSKVNIPTGFNFAPKQDPMGGVIPGGLQTQQLNVDQLLKAIKPADVLGLTGAQQAYTDVGMGKAPNPMDVLDVAGLGAVGYGAGRGLLKIGKNAPIGLSIQDAPGLLQTAPKSDIGFYSAVEQAAMASPRKSGAGQAFLNDIMKGQDVRADEIKWMGLDDYLKGKQNVTKQEVQDYIANNRVDVKEVQLGNTKFNKLSDEELINEYIRIRGYDPVSDGEALTRNEMLYELGGMNRTESGSTKFSQYTLPGGENYRELLLTMPSKLESKEAISQRMFGKPYKQLTDDERFQVTPEFQKSMGQNYNSPHFDQPNILAHLRVNDRVDADGKKMLLIEEVQSDWHQAGRDKGYKGQLTSLPDDYFVSEMQNKAGDTVYEIRKTSNPNVIINRGYNRQGAINGAINTLNETVMGVPDAPMKDTWYQLALKRAIQHAAENGYDRIGLTTGARQAERFDLSKHIDVLSASKNQDGTFNIQGFKDEGQRERGRRAPLVDESNVTAESLSGVVGKDLAKRIIDEGGGDYSGIDLRVGGEGMKKYYDEIYPKFLDKYGKKWGARVGETKVNADGMQEPIRYIDVTPEMKAGVSKGQPLFQAAPIIGTGLLGSQQDERR